MRAELLTISGVKFDSEATEVRLKTTDGELTILPQHEPLTAILGAGAVVIVDSKYNELLYVVFGGLVDVCSDKVRILADEAEYAEDIVENEIAEALENAKSLKASAKEQHELNEAQQMIDRHIVRLEVSRIRRRKQR